MPPTIFEDGLARPDLFLWFGVNESDFDKWLTELPLRVHPGLVEFWRRTGGGDVYESETLLGPLVSDEGNNVLRVNESLWGRGLPQDLLVFHTGMCFSASFVDWPRHRNRIALLKSGSFEVERWFYTFNHWYQATLRSEYAARYGLISD